MTSQRSLVRRPLASTIAANRLLRNESKRIVPGFDGGGREPFTELLRKLMMDGIGRTIWLGSQGAGGRKARTSEHGTPWGPKEIAEACGVDIRTVQTWCAVKNPQVPSQIGQRRLEALFFGSMPAREDRESFRTAWRTQQQLQKRRKTSQHWDVAERGSPYRGIATPLTEKDAAIFFGRWAQVAALTDKLRRHPCVFVVGASGAGKSSLVWAGLIPNLKDLDAIPGSRHWTWKRLTPGQEGTPIRALACALATRTLTASQAERDLCGGLHRIEKLVHGSLAGRPDKSELLLFIDQFEELFTLVADPRQRAGFIDVLAAVIATGRARLVATMRAEFLGHCTKTDEVAGRLAAWLTDGCFFLATPTADALREMIIGPAARAGARLEDGLVERIVADTGSNPGNLPLMAFALERLFAGRDGTGLMSRAAYERIGGVGGAICLRAASAFQDLLGRLGQEADRALSDVFRDLGDVDEDTGTAVRRRVPLSRLPNEGPARMLIDEFVESRLFVRDRDDAGVLSGLEREPTLEVAHEALFQSWPRLADWMECRREHLVVRKRLARAARHWEQKGRPGAYLWSDEQALDAAAMVRELPYQPTAIEAEFLGPIEPREMLQRLDLDTATHEERAKIGVRLALLGDPRPGVGLNSDGLPDIHWLRVPLSEVHPPAEQSSGLWIAKYPVTYAQYKAFIDDAEGYLSSRWWKGLDRRYTEPGDQFPNYGNHPAVNVLWCEAVAFCRWLSARTSTSIRLPTDWEWRLAATGGRRIKYPWGSTWRDNAANTDTSKLNRAVAVGLYPRGRSPVGVFDMAGNVWEWCLNDAGQSGVGLPATGSRATLGGSWNSLCEDVAVQHRGGYDLSYRNLNTGFRVVRGDAAP